MKTTRDRAEVTAIQALAFLAEDAELLSRFLALTGMDGDGLRVAASETGTLIAVLDFLMFDDRLVLAFAERSGIAPGDLAHVRLALAGPEADPD